MPTSPEHPGPAPETTIGAPDAPPPNGPAAPSSAAATNGAYPLVADEDAAWADEARDDGLPRGGGSRTWWIVGGVLVAAATALMVWIGVANARDNIEYHDVGFHVDSSAQVTARWEIDKPKDMTVTCLVRALDEKFGVVGSVDVTVPAGVTTQTTTTRIRTTSLAVTGTVRSCQKAG